MALSVLYISYDGMTDNLGQSQVIPYLIGLQKKGYSIHLLSCEKPQVFEHRNNHVAKLLQKNSIQWYPIPYTAKPAVFSTMYDIKQLQKQASHIIKTHAISLIHCRSYIAAQVGLYCNKKFGLPWIFDMRGFWADERIDGGIWNVKNPVYKTIYKHFKQLEKKYIAKSSHIISLTYAGKHEIETWNVYKKNPTPITVIPCCADLEHFDSKVISKQKVIELQKKLHLSQNNFVLSYLGSFGTWYMTHEMFEFFKVLLNKLPDAIFLCITPDSPHMLEKIARKKNIPLSSIRIVKAHREEVPLYASLSDWSLFFIKPLYSKKASSPTKMGELLGLGIPLICNAGVGDVEEIMNDCSSGFVVKEYTLQEYEQIVDAIISRPTINHNQLYSVACTYYSLQQGIHAYDLVYKQCIAL